MKGVRIAEFILAILLILATLHFCSRFAAAHDWYSGLQNPRTGLGCCGEADCDAVDVGRVEETADYFILDGKWHFPKDEARPAWDGQYHACIVSGEPRCFFYPSNV